MSGRRLKQVRDHAARYEHLVRTTTAIGALSRKAIEAGRELRDALEDHVIDSPEAVHDDLAVLGIDIPLSVIERWMPRDIQDASAWAAAVDCEAQGVDDVEVPPQPACVRVALERAAFIDGDPT